jgi:hypothetical protein
LHFAVATQAQIPEEYLHMDLAFYRAQDNEKVTSENN